MPSNNDTTSYDNPDFSAVISTAPISELSILFDFSYTPVKVQVLTLSWSQHLSTNRQTDQWTAGEVFQSVSSPLQKMSQDHILPRSHTLRLTRWKHDQARMSRLGSRLNFCPLSALRFEHFSHKLHQNAFRIFFACLIFKKIIIIKLIFYIYFHL